MSSDNLSIALQLSCKANCLGCGRRVNFSPGKLVPFVNFSVPKPSSIGSKLIVVVVVDDVVVLVDVVLVIEYKTTTATATTAKYYMSHIVLHPYSSFYLGQSAQCKAFWLENKKLMF